MDECTRALNTLMLEDGQKRQTDDGRAYHIAMSGKDICRCCAFEEQEGDKDKDLGEDARRVGVGIDAKGGKTSDEEEDDGEAVEETKGNVHKDRVEH